MLTMQLILKISISAAVFFALILASSSFSIPHVQTHADLTGRWQNESKPETNVVFTQVKGTSYVGKMVKATAPSSEASDEVFKNLRYNAKSNTYKGTMSPPGKNVEIDMTISFVSKDRLKAVAKKFLMTKTFYFTRVQG